jgi:lysozyme
MDINTLLASLERDEGFVSHAYQDSEGYWTIGIGRLVDAGKGGGITKDEAHYLLGNDVKRTLAELDNSFPWWRNLPEKAQQGLANMAFNMGLGTLLKFKKTLQALKDGEFETAAVEALDSKWARQVGDRAKRIAELFRSCG